MVAAAASRLERSWRPTVDEVAAAVRSLYGDELRPMGRIVLRRLRERAAAAAGHEDVEAVPMIEPRYLRELCEGCRLFAVEPSEGKEYAVLVRGEAGTFVDPVNACDPYPGNMWQAFGEYVAGLSDEESTLPSGRYACAQVLSGRCLAFLQGRSLGELCQVLSSRGLAFFQGRSLGELCHIVQLATAARRIFGHASGHTVPYVRSDECNRLLRAVRQLPVTDAASELPFASWEQLALGLQTLLAVAGAVSISNLKRHFRTDFGLELSETVLGHSRLADVMADGRLAGVCRVHAQGGGQSLVCPVGFSGTWQMMPQPMLPQACAAAPCPGSTCASSRIPAAPLAFSPPAASRLVLWPSSPAASTASVASVALPVPATLAVPHSPTRGEPTCGDAIGGASDVVSGACRSACDDEKRSYGSAGTASTWPSCLLGDGGESEDGDFAIDFSAESSLDLEHYGLVVKNGFLEDAPKRRHVRSRSA